MNFTPRQLAAVEVEDVTRDTCIVAVPGSGKTTVLVEFYRRLVVENVPVRVTSCNSVQKTPTARRAIRAGIMQPTCSAERCNLCLREQQSTLFFFFSVKDKLFIEATFVEKLVMFPFMVLLTWPLNIIEYFIRLLCAFFEFIDRSPVCTAILNCKELTQRSPFASVWRGPGPVLGLSFPELRVFYS